MQNNLNQFIAEKTGQSVSFDGDPANIGQYVQLSAQWYQYVDLPVIRLKSAYI